MKEKQSIKEEHLAEVVIPTRSLVPQAQALTATPFQKCSKNKSLAESNADSQGRTSLSYIYYIPKKLHSKNTREQIVQHRVKNALDLGGRGKIEENTGFEIQDLNGELAATGAIYSVQWSEKIKCHLTEFIRFSTEVPEADSSRNRELVLNVQSGE